MLLLNNSAMKCLPEVERNQGISAIFVHAQTLLVFASRGNEQWFIFYAEYTYRVDSGLSGFFSSISTSRKKFARKFLIRNDFFFQVSRSFSCFKNNHYRLWLRKQNCSIFRSIFRPYPMNRSWEISKKKKITFTLSHTNFVQFSRTFNFRVQLPSTGIDDRVYRHQSADGPADDHTALALCRPAPGTRLNKTDKRPALSRSPYCCTPSPPSPPVAPLPFSREPTLSRYRVFVNIPKGA